MSSEVHTPLRPCEFRSAPLGVGTCGSCGSRGEPFEYYQCSKFNEFCADRRARVNQENRSVKYRGCNTCPVVLGESSSKMITSSDDDSPKQSNDVADVNFVAEKDLNLFAGSKATYTLIYTGIVDTTLLPHYAKTLLSKVNNFAKVLWSNCFDAASSTPVIVGSWHFRRMPVLPQCALWDTSYLVGVLEKIPVDRTLDSLVTEAFRISPDRVLCTHDVSVRLNNTPVIKPVVVSDVVNVGISVPSWNNAGVERWVLQLAKIPNVLIHVHTFSPVGSRPTGWSELPIKWYDSKLAVLGVSDVYICWTMQDIRDRHVRGSHCDVIYVRHQVHDLTLLETFRRFFPKNPVVSVFSSEDDSTVICNAVEPCDAGTVLSIKPVTEKWLLYHGRIADQQKNCKRLLSDISRFPPEWRLAIKAPRPLRLEWPEASRNPRVVDLNQFSVEDCLASADVCVSLSRDETFGYSIAEAIAAKRPLVSTRVGFLLSPEFDAWEFLQPSVDSQQFLEACVSAVTMPSVELSRRADFLTNTFSIGKFIAAWSELFSRVS